MRYVRSREVLWRRVGTGVVVTALGDEGVSELVGGAAAIWNEFATPGGVDAVVDRLAVKTGMPPEDLRAQVMSCVEQLTAMRVLEAVG